MSVSEGVRGRVCVCVCVRVCVCVCVCVLFACMCVCVCCLLVCVLFACMRVCMCEVALFVRACVFVFVHVCAGVGLPLTRAVPSANHITDAGVEALAAIVHGVSVLSLDCALPPPPPARCCAAHECASRD